MTLASTVDAAVRVAIVDDSRSIRRWLRLVLEQDPRFRVVAEAGNGSEARDVLRHHKVDVMTLDVDMPGMTGLQFLSRLMYHHPMPVVMVSALTEQGSREAIEALSLGAVDCIEKPRTAVNPDISRDICERVWLASQTQVRQGRAPNAARAKLQPAAPARDWKDDVLLLGASTGGVTALEQVLREVDSGSCPVVIAQHMPENFLRSFCRRLNEQFARTFVLAETGLVLQAGQVVLSLGKEVSTRLVRRPGGRIECQLGTPSDEAIYRPCVDDLFNSAAVAGLKGCAAVLTGMGADGANGLLALRQAGFSTWAQDEASCVVYGMPKAAVENGAAQKSADPTEIGRRMAQFATSTPNHGRGV